MSKKKAVGQCFYNSYQTLMSLNDRDAKLVHGIVWHEKTGWHVHGWVELGGYCFDTLNGKLAVVPKERYYSIGKIKTGPGEIFKYTKEQAMKMATKSNYYYFSNLPCNQ